MTLLKNNRKYAFQSFGGKEPTTEQLRAEVEKMYRFLEEKLKSLDSSAEESIDVHDEVLTDGNSNIIYAAGDVVMITNIPNS